MKRKVIAVLNLFLLLCNCCGCNQQPADSSISGFRVVTAVTVFYENGPIQALRHYTSDGKMQQILDYLRLISPYGTPGEDPETAAGSDYQIVLSYSDGKQKTYRQKADRFLQGVDGRWQNIDPSQAEDLARILGQLESDSVL